jgi:hypothetical protein
MGRDPIYPHRTGNDMLDSDGPQDPGDRGPECLRCPQCGEILEDVLGEAEGQLFDGVRCPNGCALR